MDDTATAPHPPATEPEIRNVDSNRSAWILVLALLVGAAVGVATSRGLEATSSTAQSPPSTSTDAGFARDMQVHHAQAVEMSFLIRDRSTDPIIRSMALDIATTQQQQIGQMYAWLELWGVSQTATGEPMTWMAQESSGAGAGTDHSTMDHDTGSPRPSGVSAPMPGMATPEELERLEGSRGAAAETLWLRLMIRHHRAGVDMAEAALAGASQREVLQLADSIVTSQESEIAQMTKLLAQRDR